MSRKTTLIPKRIAQIRFSLMDPVEIRKMSSVEVKTPDTYKDDGHAYRQGLMDPHMGVICLLYTSPSPRDNRTSRMPSSA